MATGISSSIGALQTQIQQTQVELNDWTTCVSAKTPKGQAEIQKLSGELSAAKERVANALRAQSAQSTPKSAQSTPAAQLHSHAADAPGRPGTLDVWA